MTPADLAALDDLDLLLAQLQLEQVPPADRFLSPLTISDHERRRRHTYTYREDR